MTRQEDPIRQLRQERAYLSARLEDATRELTQLDLLNLELTLQKRQALAAFRFIEILHEKIALSVDLDDLYDTVVRTITTDLFVDIAALLRVDLRTRRLYTLAAAGLPGSAKKFKPIPGIPRRTLLEPTFANSQSPLDPFSLFARDRLGTPCFVWYPVAEEGDDLLVLLAGNRTEDLVSKQPFSRASLEIFGAISSALLLRRDQTFRQEETSEELAEKNRLLAAFQRIGELILSSLDLEQILDDLARQIVQAGIFRSIAIALVDEPRRSVEVVRSITWQPEEGISAAADASSPPGRRYDLDGDSIVAEVARTGRMCVVAGDDARCGRRNATPDLRRDQVTYFIPIRQGSRVLAVLATDSLPEEKEALLRRIEVMQPLLNQVAIALEHARLYQRLRDSQERVRQAQKMEAVGQLTAGMAHNFNNILQVTMGNLELAICEAPQNLKPYLLDAEKSVHRAIELVDQLMLFTRRDKGVDFAPVDLRAVIDETVGICRETFDKRIEIAVDSLPDPVVVWGHAAQLQQVLLNLCLNARDAFEGVEHSCHRIQITAAVLHLDAANLVSRPGSAPGPHVRLQVSDNGIGMESKVRERIFEPFFTTKEVGKGTGLGLATVYAIVQEHQGWIECTSAPRVGTTFSVYLPVCDSQTILETEPESRQAQGGKEAILVVDDEEMVRHTTRRILEQAGYTVLEAVDGKEGLEVFNRERGRIDLVLLDLSMPRMSGEETLAEIRRLSPEVKVIFFTGYPVGDARYAGVQGLLGKPIGGFRLLETVRGVLGA